MTQSLLALYRDYAVPIPPEQTQQVWADVNADAAVAYATVSALTTNPVEQAFLDTQRAALSGGGR